VTWTHYSVLFEITWGKTRSVRADARVRPRGREKELVVVASLERENFFSIFNFRFSIPKIPKIPKIPELRALRKKKKVFSA
jgi:hypothetical protein